MISIDKDSPVPLHHQLRRALEEEILSGRLAPGAVLPPETQLCATLGVSRTTVRKAILDLAQQGLVVRKPARGTFVSQRRRARHTIVIAAFGIPSLAPQPGSELFFRLWQGLAAAAGRRGMEVAVRSFDAPPEERAGVLQRLAAEPATLGVAIFTWGAVSWEQIRSLHEAAFPYVLLNRYVPGRDVPAVTLDDHTAVAGAVRRLYELGHRRILFLGNENRDSTAQRDREAGYLQAMAELGVAGLARVETCDWQESSARRTVARILAEPEPPTAFIAASGYLAAGAATAAQVRGLHVPMHVSVIGVDDTLRVADAVPPITAIDYAPDRIGEAAVELLCRQAGGELAARVRRRVPVGLIERSSCAPPVAVRWEPAQALRG